MKTPAGTDDVNLVNGAPGFLNGTSGATGAFSVTPPGLNTTVLVGLAIHVTDTAGPSHSLSSLNDPAFADLLIDLNHSAVSGPINPSAYPFNAPPPQFADAVNTLSLSESALGGQPFDILLTAKLPQLSGLYRWWSVDMSQEINNLDGITALSVTDFGAIPEPAALPLLATLALLPRPRRRPA